MGLASTPPTNRPPGIRQASLSLVPDFASEEADSGVFAASEHSVLLLCRPSEDLRAVLRTLQEDGFSVAPLADASRVEALGFLPRYALIETRSPGALAFLAKVVRPAQGCTAIALLEPNEPEGPALEAGAALSLRRPVNARDV